MKIIKNLSPLMKLAGSMKKLRKSQLAIRAAKADGNFELERKLILETTTFWGKWLQEEFNVKVNVSGAENLPENGPVVFVSNHQGYADVAAFCAAVDKLQFGFIAKKELSKIPMLGAWLKDIRSVLIERDHPREALKAINSGIELLNNGFGLVIFPEGTRSRGEHIGEFKKGAFRLATKPQVPIVPVAINGTWKVFERDGYFHGNETIDFHILPPHETAGLNKNEANALAERVEREIRDEFEKLLIIGKERENGGN